MVDGARMASVTEGQAYNGTLSPRQHVISVSASGPQRGTAPGRRSLINEDAKAADGAPEPEFSQRIRASLPTIAR